MAVFKMSSARGIQMMYIYLTAKLLRYPSLAVKLSSPPQVPLITKHTRPFHIYIFCNTLSD
jgi:hypothetical protein